MSRRNRGAYTVAPPNVAVFLRQHTGMTQAQFADECGLKTIDISKVERGIYKMQLWKIQKLANYLSIPIDAILHNRFDQAVTGLRTLAVMNQTARSALRTAQMSRVENGQQGEDLVVEWEREKLAGTIYANAVDGNYASDPAYGFDVLSFTRAGELLYLEVKASAEKEEAPFFMSAHEKAFMEYCHRTGARYELHQILDVRGTPRRIVYTLEDLMNCTFTPNEYLVKMENNR